MGRSRGGLTGKIHAVVGHERRAMFLLITFPPSLPPASSIPAEDSPDA
jgi:hypothetical protein